MTHPAHNFDDSAAYERSMGKWSRAVGRVFLDWLAPPTQAHWLDVGCGTGAFTTLIREGFSPASLLAVDSEEAQIAYARSHALGAAEFRVAPAEALPFAAKTFDVVASALLINFVADRPRALAEMPASRGRAESWGDTSGISPPTCHPADRSVVR